MVHEINCLSYLGMYQGLFGIARQNTKVSRSRGRSRSQFYQRGHQVIGIRIRIRGSNQRMTNARNQQSILSLFRILEVQVTVA